MPVLRNTPNLGVQSKKTTQSDDAHMGVVQSDNNTAQAKKQLALADTGTTQPSTSGTQPNDQIAQMLQMVQKTFDEQLKFQRDQQQFQKEQQKHADSQLPPLEKIPVIDWTHNDGLHSQYTIWKEQWNAIFKSDYPFASDAVKVHKLYRHIGKEGQKKIKKGKLNLDDITLDQLFEHLDEECKPGDSAYRSRSDLWHNTKQGNMTLDDFYNKIERLCDLCSFSPEEHKAFHRDAFLFNLSTKAQSD